MDIKIWTKYSKDQSKLNTVLETFIKHHNISLNEITNESNIISLSMADKIIRFYGVQYVSMEIN